MLNLVAREITDRL